MRRGREEKGEVKRGSCKGEKEEKRSGREEQEDKGREVEGFGRMERGNMPWKSSRLSTHTIWPHLFCGLTECDDPSVTLHRLHLH